MQNTISSSPVADFFLLQNDVNAGDAITNLKLQKLCYYAQAWHLALHRTPLFRDRIEAWAHGPIVPSLYRRFKSYRWLSIDPSEASSDPYVDLHASDISFLEQIWDRYGSLTAKQLEKLTHGEDPWRRAYGGRPLGSSCAEEITHESMIAFYEPLLKKVA